MDEIMLDLFQLAGLTDALYEVARTDREKLADELFLMEDQINYCLSRMCLLLGRLRDEQTGTGST